MSGTNTCDVPFMNTDIGGIGVRLSFYLQTLFLAALSARSETLHEATGALSTLIATNMAMAVAALILGLKREPEISLQDGMVICYLLAMSWVTVFFSLPSFHRFPAGTKQLKFLSILQSYLIFAYALVILISAKNFGNSSECNIIAVVVLFRPFSALKVGRIIGWIVVIAITSIYTVITAIDYLPPRAKDVLQWAGRRRTKTSDDQVPTSALEPVLSRTSQDPATVPRRVLQPGVEVPIHDLNISGQLVVKLILILISWAVAVTNTELLILWNHLKQDPSAQSPWQFGQVLPMFLLVQPFTNLVSTFSTYKLSPRRNVKGRD